ncbi:MAG: GntR family transcriptional regulator [Pseudorhodobacter sp.]
MPETPNLQAAEAAPRFLIADQVQKSLLAAIVTLELPPGTRISEAEIAARMEVSRQPVRDAFFRLSQQGFLVIQPQRATKVSLIDPQAVMQARFIRAAIEAEIARIACTRLDDGDLSALEDILDAQRSAAGAGQDLQFMELDEAFHRELCLRSGHEHAWAAIQENKPHMDRVRFLSLSFGAPEVLAGHVAVMAAIKARDTTRAMAEMRAHLSRIKTDIHRIRAGHPRYFVAESGAQ